MKKTLLFVAVLGVAVLALGAVGIAYAHGPNPGTPDGTFPYGYGHGMMGGYAMYGEEGPMHEAMVAAVADALGLTPEEIEARHDAGETLWDIAAAQGLSDEEIQDLMLSTHDIALEQAVAEGLLTAEQAEWMVARMGSMWTGEHNHSCDGTGRMGW